MKSMIYPLVNTHEKVIYVCFFMIIKCALAKRRRLTDISTYQTIEQGFAHILINWLIQKSILTFLTICQFPFVRNEVLLLLVTFQLSTTIIIHLHFGE